MINLCFIKEMWRNIIIKNDITKYDISNYGKVKNRNTGKILKLARNHKNYLVVDLWHDGKKIRKSIHRLVAIAFMEILNPENFTVNHKNYDKDDNWHGNLEWMTNSDNVKDSYKNGHRDFTYRSIRIQGSKNPNTPYYDEQIIKVCKLLEKGLKYKDIEKLTDVKVKNISGIATRMYWKHISKDYDFKPSRKSRKNKEIEKFKTIKCGDEELIILERRTFND